LADPAVIAGIGVAGTILGTVAGAGISARVTTKLEKRREIREKNQDAADLRMAVRLVRLDMITCRLSLRAITIQKRWLVPTLAMRTEAWDEHGTVIARHLRNPDDWQEVMLAIQLVQNFEFAAVGLKDKQEAPPLLLATADTMIEPLDRCIDSLGKLIGDRGVPAPPPMPWPFTS
jgi:hypothetical protein